MLWKFIKLLVFLALLGAIGLVVFAYVGPVLMPSEFAPVQTDMTQPVTLESN